MIAGGNPWTIESQYARGKVHELKYSPDSRYLASAGDDGSIRIWQAENGDLVRVLVGHDDGIRYLAWSPDGAFLASSGEHSIRIWDIDEARAIHNLPAEFCAVAWSPDSGRLAGGNHVWDVKTGDVVLQFDAELGGNGLFQAMDWSPDGRLLATGAGEGSIRFADAVSGKQVRALPGQNGAVRSLGWCPGNDLLASVSGDGKSVFLWESKTGKLVRNLECPFYETHIAWSPDGKKMALSSYYGIGIHHPSSGSPLTGKGIRAVGPERSPGHPMADGSPEPAWQAWSSVVRREANFCGSFRRTLSIACPLLGRLTARDWRSTRTES